MAITAADFIVELSPSPIKVVLGMSGTMTMTFSNTNLTDAGYNLAIETILPDGVSFGGSSVTPTSIQPGPSGTIIINWTNIKDLAPNEVGYTIELTLNSDTTFRATGLPVPFDTPLVSVDMSATLDTLPRGNEPGNQKITKTDNANFIPIRYDLIKSAPKKIPKGAGYLTPSIPAFWIYEYTLTVQNNSSLASTVTLIDTLPNGVRYLGGLNVVGPDALALSSPVITTPSGTQNNTIIDWGTVILSAGSVNVITFDAAIWNNYTTGGVENSGDRILHMTPMENIAELDGASGIVSATAITNAMDATIDKSVSPTITDVGNILTYTLVYAINQYNDIDDFEITDLIGDGQTYNTGSASIAPTSIILNPDGTTQLFWDLGNQTTTSSGTITFTTTVDTTYYTGDPVFAGDTLINNVTSDGINHDFLTPAPDSSSASAGIITPVITKTLLNYYYKDGTTIKPFNVASPGDFVEFRIDYDAFSINAEQRDIRIDEYAPLNMGPMTAVTSFSYGGTLPGPFTPFTVSPNGLRWNLGDLAGNTVWDATFKVPVDNIVFVGKRNNLAKLAGKDSEGLGYSDRDQVEVAFGTPNIQFGKTVSPLTNPVQSGETYTYSVTISNPQNIGGTVTDAFNMLLTDVIPTGMTYTGVNSVTGTGLYTTPVFAGQNSSMTITKLAPGQSLTFNYVVVVDIGVAPGAILKNNAILQRPYSQSDNSFQYPGAPFRASVIKNVVDVTISKTALPTIGKVGDDITYTITVTIPNGTIAYTPKVIDTLPNGQMYVGPATRQVPPGIPSSVTPTLSGQEVIFPDNPDIDASDGMVQIIYTFIARITSANHMPPYYETQTDKAIVQWAIESGGDLDRSSETTFDITVTMPNLVLLKEQKNVTLGGAYTTSDIITTTGDVIHYRLSVTSNGASPAYDILLQDVLSDCLAFDSIISGPTVGSVTPPSPPPSATLVWNIPQLNNGAPTAVLEFSVINISNKEKVISNSTSAIYYSNESQFLAYNAQSNQVDAKTRFGKVFDKETGEPICNAKVELFQNRTLVEVVYTDWAGIYQLNNLDEGNYRIQVTKCCYLPICYCDTVNLNQEYSKIYDFYLAKDCICNIKCEIQEIIKELVQEKQRVYKMITDYFILSPSTPDNLSRFIQLLCILESSTAELDCCIGKVLENLVTCETTKD